MAAMHDLSSGPIRGHLLRMSLFMLVTMIVQTLYGLIDLFWVGHLGGSAVAAVSIGGNVMMATMTVSQVLAVGASSLIAQAAGRRDPVATGELFNQSALLAGIIGVLLGTALFLGRQAYATALAGDAHTAGLTADFLFWFTPAMALQVPMMVLSSALRGVGNVRIASIAQLATILLNIVLAPVLIFGWGTGRPLGVAGAALATLISIVLGMAGMLWHIVGKKLYFTAGAGQWRARTQVWRRISAVGLPSGLEFGLLAIYMTAIMALLRPFGAGTQAGFGVGMRILQLGMMPSMAIAFAASAVVGQNFGAGRFDRVRETFWLSLKLSSAACIVFVVLFHAIPDLLIRPFSTEPGVVQAGVDFLRLISWNLLASGVVFACFGVFSGLGDTRPSLIGSAARVTLILVPAVILSNHAGFVPSWIWWLSVMATVVQVLVNVFFLRRRFTVSTVLDPQPAGLTN